MILMACPLSVPGDVRLPEGFSVNGFGQCRDGGTGIIIYRKNRYCIRSIPQKRVYARIGNF